MSRNTITELDAVESLAHDLKGPVAAARSWVDFIQHQGALNKQQLESMNRALQSLDKAAAMITDMLALTQMDGDLRRSAVDLGAALEQCIELLQPRAAERDVHLQWHRPAVPVVIYADEVLVKRLLDNLVQNAIKFNREGGEVRVVVSDHGAFVRVDVQDSGPGIPIEEQLFVFDRFYRGMDHRRARERGSGMGLAICKMIVDKHQGRIWLESTPGKGSTFSFVLPSATDHMVAGQNQGNHADLMRGDEASESADGVDDNQQESSEYPDSESRHDEV